MAKRSDLAQKLLDDLRMRKERMGVATASQHSAKGPYAGNANGNSRWAFRGSGEATSSRSSNRNIPSTEVTKMRPGASHHRAPSFEGASQGIIPIGNTRSREQGIDLSMALALALSNTGKLQNIEVFSNATGAKTLSLNFREMNGIMPSTSDQFPLLSPLQIGEISKGVQQLNMIIKACSNGVTFSRDSIDIGRELLKGAIDLEESLRMLVSLQDASDYMAGTQRKQIKLLKGKDDESSSEESNNKKLMRPKFSFDRPSKNSRQHVKAGSNSDLLEFLKTPRSNSNKSSSNASLQISYHRPSSSNPQLLGHANRSYHKEDFRSFSKDGDFSTSTNVKQSGSKGGAVREKVRIPSVVAKLMGLEELPLEMPVVKKNEVQNVPNSKHITLNSKIKADVGFRNKEANQMTYATPNMKGQDNLEAIQFKVKQNAVELNRPELKNHVVSEAPQFSSKEKNIGRMGHCKEGKVAKKEAPEARKKASSMQQLKKEPAEQSSIRKPVTEHGAQYTTQLQHENCGGPGSNCEKPQRNKDAIPMQPKNTQSIYPAIPTVPVPHQQSASLRMRTKHSVYKTEEKLEPNNGNKLQCITEEKMIVKLNDAEVSCSDMNTEKVSTSTSTRTTRTVPRSLSNFSYAEQPKEDRRGQHKEQKKLQSRNFAYHNIDRKSANRMSEENVPLKEVTKTEKEKSIPLIPVPASRKPVPSSSGKKVEITNPVRARNENRGTIVKEKRRMKIIEAKQPNLKQKTSFLHELEHRWKERTGKAEKIISSQEVKSDHNPQQAIVPDKHLCTSEGSEISSLSQIITQQITVVAPQQEATNPRQSPQMTTTIDPDPLHSPEICLKEDLELQPNLEEDKAESIVEGTSSSHAMQSKKDLQLAVAHTNNMGSFEESEIPSLSQIITEQTTMETQQEAADTVQSPDTTLTDLAALKAPEIYVKEDLEPQPLLEEGSDGQRQLVNCDSLECHNIATSKVHDQGPHTKEEYTLEQILMNSKQFLETAQAVFKIKVPFCIRQTVESICPLEGDKLVLDTSYELMRRKGRREEALSSKTRFFVLAKERCLDDLLKELKNNLESLEMPSKNKGADNDIAEYLHTLVERDMENRSPDVNCMWDNCWNSMTFAYIEKEEIVRDVEKHVLNGLINDLARDLISVSISVE